MATTIKQVEGFATNATMIMSRIEAYIAHRYSPRSIEWIVEGPGEWEPPLIPATIATIEIWNGAAWEAITTPDSPLGGYWLSGHGPYRFAGTVGGGNMPDVVGQAHTRLYNYLAAISENTPGARSVNLTIPDVMQEHIERDPNWIARAMQQSGAADLLRPYRKA